MAEDNPVIAPAQTPAGARPMRLLMTMNVPYTRSHGGANRSNLGLIEGLVKRGHEAWVVAPALAQPSPVTYKEWLADLGVEWVAEGEDAIRFGWGGVQVVAVRDAGKVRSVLAAMIARLDPDRILVSSEDPSQSLLAAALEAGPERVVYLALTPPLFPFGPAALYPSEARTELVRRAGRIVCLSRIVAEQIQEHARVPATVYAPPSFGAGPFARIADYDGGAVLLMNACAVKGLPIFLDLARAFPGQRFAALPGYGTTAEDRAALAALPNVELWKNERELDALFARTKAVVVPSLWMESFGMVVVDAMLRGIPVLAADEGALPEAALGTAELLPVNPITRYERELGENLLPVPIVPEQDSRPWVEALALLLADREVWEAASLAAHRAATEYVAGLTVEPFETLLAEEIAAAPRATAAPAKATASLDPQQRAALLRKLRAGVAPAAAPSIPRVARGEGLPLSYAQSRLYFLWRLDPASAAYNCPMTLRLNGALDQSALERALTGLVARHEALRTTFAEGPDGPVQHIQPPEFPTFEYLETSRDEAEALLARAAAVPFDLEQERPFRAHLVRIAADEHLLQLNIHHIATDGWSSGVILRDLAALYAGEAVDAPALDYADYAQWQRTALGGPELDRLLGYWTDMLAGAPPVIELPTDRPRPASPTRPGGNRALRVPAALAERLKAVGQGQGASLYMVLLAAFGVLLHRLGRAEDVVIGAPVANRTRPEFEKMVGFFVNTLPLRLRFVGNPGFDTLLAQVRETVVQGLAHQALPTEKLVEALAPARTLSHTPLFQVLFSLQNSHLGDLAMPGLNVSPAESYSGTAKLDLNLELTETAEGLEGTLEFDRDLFDSETIDAFVLAYGRLLEGIAEAPGRAIGALALTSEGPAAENLSADGDPDLMEIVRHGMALAPSQPALWAAGETLDHAALDRWSDRIAQLLPANQAVAICLDRSPAMIAAVLGTLKAGAACVPLDPAHPAERIGLMLETANAAAILTERRHAHLFATSAAPVILLDDPDLVLPEPGPNPVPHPLTPAYILFTSGSTGRPKGVSFPRAALANLILWHLGKFPGPARMLQFASLGFDASFHEILATLAGGGTLYLLGEHERRDLDVLPRFLAKHAIAKAILPVVAIHRLAEAMAAPDAPVLALEHLTSTGEALVVTPAVGAWLARTPGLTLHNDYGPTETHVVTAVTVSDLPELGAPFPPIGRPIRATGVRILDAYLNPVPPGLPGELFLAGACLATGYHDRPEATAEKFLPDPAGRPGERMYRTGDLVRERADGQLVYLGRIDQQIKIRGHRIEPGEVEKALLAIPGVGDCLVVARGNSSEERQLVAYLVPEDAPAPKALGEQLRRILPSVMVPSAFVRIARFPLNANGKIDRTALPAPTPADTEAGGEAAGGAPRTPLEQALAAIWGEVLGRDAIGVDDNFFALGGHSLLMIQVTVRIARELHVELPIQQFFDAPTIAAQSEAVAALIEARADEDDLAALLDEIEALGEDEAGRLVASVSPEREAAIAAWVSAAIAVADPTARTPKVEAIGFPSSNRAELLDGAIRSYAANLLEHGRSVEIVVASDPADAGQNAAYRTMLESVARDTGLPVRFAGAAEKRAYAERLAAETGIEPGLLAWAIGDEAQSGAAWGANRNALLLDGAGSLSLSFDDDTRGKLRLPNAAEPGVALWTERRVSEIRVLSGGATEGEFVSPAGVDLIAAHQGILGQPVGAILRMSEHDGGHADPAALGAAEQARVVATYHGWAGDSGWESGAEVRFLSGAAWEWATRSEDAYWDAIEQPSLVRYAERTALSRAPEFFALGSGYDGRADLPPFLPRFRREDVLYGVSLERGLAGGFVAHLPVLVEHGRPRRAGRPGQDSIDVAEVVETLFATLPAGQGWAALGAGLAEAGRMAPADFRAHLESLIVARVEHELERLDERIRKAPRDRAFWAQDARASADILRARLKQPGNILPRLAFKAASAEAAQVALQGFLVDLGRLYAAWPEAMAAAARLRRDGIRLSQQVG
jgi:amino acid adenylation domain-containing protein